MTGPAALAIMVVEPASQPNGPGDARMLDREIHQTRSEFLEEHKDDERQGQPADERRKAFRRDIWHQQPSTNYPGKRGRQHPKNETALSVSPIRVDGKDVSQNKHRKDRSGGFTSGKHSRHDQNREHPQTAETCFRHADSRRRYNGEKPIDRCEVVHLVTE